MPVKYQFGKIYKIISNHGDKVYIGSTCLPRLCTRLAKHKSNYNCWKNGTSGKTTSYDLFDEYGTENCQIILLETHPCSSKDELKLRERFFIESLNCVNKNIPGRTMKEYYQENKDKIKEYRDENKNVINEKANAKCTCDICGIVYTQSNKSKHFKSKKHINAIVVDVSVSNPQSLNTPEPQHLTV